LELSPEVFQEEKKGALGERKEEGFYNLLK
jgi:hypothetical protein